MCAEPINGFETMAVVSRTPNTHAPTVAAHTGHNREHTACQFTVDSRFFLWCSGGKDNAQQVASPLAGLDR